MKINRPILPLFPECTGTAASPFTVFLAGLLFVLTVAFISILIGRYATGRFGGNKKKTTLVFIGISAVVAVLLFCFFGLSVRSITGSIFCLLLLTASYSDIKTRECDDWLSVMILLTGLIGTEVQTIPLRIVSMAFVTLLMLIPSFFTKDGIGGADIKIAAASAFLLGLQRGLLGLTVGLLLAVVVNLIKNRKNTKEGFPMIPYLVAPFMAAYFI